MKKTPLILSIILLVYGVLFVNAAVPTQNNPFLLSVTWPSAATQSAHDVDEGIVYLNFTGYDNTTHIGIILEVEHGTLGFYRIPLRPACYDATIQTRLVSYYNSTGNISYSYAECYNGTDWLRASLLSISTMGDVCDLTASNSARTYDANWATYALYNASGGWWNTANDTLSCADARWYDISLRYIAVAQNRTGDYLGCFPMNATDADGDELRGIYDWSIDGVYMAVIAAIFDGNTSRYGDYSYSGNTLEPGNTADPWVYDRGIVWDGLYFRGASVGGDYINITDVLDSETNAWNETDQDFTYLFYISYTDADCTPCINQVADCDLIIGECECISSYETKDKPCLWFGVGDKGQCGDTTQADACAVIGDRTQEVLINRGVDEGYSILLNSETGRIRFYNRVSNYTLTTPAGSVSPEEWASVMLVRNGRSTKIYVNGVQRASGTDTGSISVDVNEMKISYPVNEYYGFFDEFYVYDKAMTADQITFSYGLGLAGWAIIHPSMTDCDQNWTCAITLHDRDNSTAAALYLIEKEESNIISIICTVLTDEEIEYRSIRDNILYILIAFSIFVLILAATILIWFVVNGGDLLSVAGTIVALALGFGILIALLAVIIRAVA